jgi:hypothetical protein
MKYDNEDDGKSPQSLGSIGRNSYGFLKRSSSRLGHIATRTLSDIRVALHKEINLPSSRQFFSIGHQSSQVPSVGDNANPVVEEKEDRQRMEPPDEEKLKEIVQRSNEVICDARAVWPFDLFPNEITLDRTKVTIVERSFFWSKNTMSFRVEDILNVSVATGPRFGAITFASRVMSSVDHFTVSFLWRGDALYLKTILQGYIIAQQNKINVAHLEHDSLIETLLELGQDVATR